MSVKEVISLLKSARKFTITYGENYAEFFSDDPMMIEAFGKYEVDYIRALEDAFGHYEIGIAMRPVVAERK